VDINLLSERHARKLNQRRILIQRSIEYKQVAKRSIMPGLIIKSYNKKLTKTELLLLLINISEDEGYEVGSKDRIKTAPKLKIKRGHRTFYRTRDQTIYLAEKPHSLNAHALLHEFAHHVCNPVIWQARRDAIMNGRRKPSYHGRFFTIYMEYLIHEYRQYWDV
jgi:hypothetical protein